MVKSLQLEDGDMHGAVRILCSNEEYTPPDASSYAILQSRHPPSPPDRRKITSTTSPLLFVQLSNIRFAVRSFAPGSSGGHDGLRPQHIRDMLDTSAPGTLDQALLDFTNFTLSGGMPVEVRPVFFGEMLHALAKAVVCVRPIAIGMMLRRLVS